MVWVPENTAHLGEFAEEPTQALVVLPGLPSYDKDQRMTLDDYQKGIDSDEIVVDERAANCSIPDSK